MGSCHSHYTILACSVLVMSTSGFMTVAMDIFTLAGAAPDPKGPVKVLEVVAKAVARAAGIPTAAEQAEQLQQQPHVAPGQAHAAATAVAAATGGGAGATGEQLQSGVGGLQVPEGAVPSQGGQWSTSMPLRGYRR